MICSSLLHKLGILSLFLLLFIIPCFASTPDDEYDVTTPISQGYSTTQINIVNVSQGMTLYQIVFAAGDDVVITGGGVDLNVKESTVGTTRGTADVSIDGDTTTINFENLDLSAFTNGRYLYIPGCGYHGDGGTTDPAPAGYSPTGLPGLGIPTPRLALVGHQEIWYTEPPAYTADLSSTGTFCLAHAIAFNLSETVGQTWGIYSISGYLNGQSPATVFAMDIDTGPLTVTRVLEPGNWSVVGDIQINNEHYESWNNFTISSTCTPATFNGTINGTYNPWVWTNFTWNWTNPFGAPWNWTPPATYNDTFIHEMWELGYINDTEWQEYMDYWNWSAEHPSPANMSSYSDVLEEMDNSVKTSRANLNSSHTILSQSMGPVLVMFPYAMNFFSPQIIDLIGVILAIDLAILILARNKE